MLDRIMKLLHKKQKRNKKAHTPKMDYYYMVLSCLFDNPESVFTSYTLSAKIRVLHGVPMTPKTALNCLLMVAKTNKKIKHFTVGNTNYFTVYEV